MDADLDGLSREELLAKLIELRNAVRAPSGARVVAPGARFVAPLQRTPVAARSTSDVQQNEVLR